MTYNSEGFVQSMLILHYALRGPSNRSKKPPHGARRWGSCLLSLLLTLTTYANAHHSHANLDLKKSQVHKGTVTKFSWSMPHVYIKVNAPNNKGKIVQYSIEMLHPPGMAERGWNRKTFKKGDLITWAGPPDRNPNRYYSGLSWAEKADGTRLTLDITPSPVEASSDFTGLWSRHLDVAMRYRPPEDWPYTLLAKQLVAKFDDSQNPQIDCQNPGPPKANLLPYPLKITRPNHNVIIIEYEARNLPRTIYLDRNRAPGNASPLGHSVGWFEGDELVIETTNFTADRWGNYTGVDSSAQKHLIERLSLSEEGLAIDMKMTVSDSEYLTTPVVIEHKLRKLPDRNLVQTSCTPESAKMYLETIKN